MEERHSGREKGIKCSTGAHGEDANSEYTIYTAKDRNPGTLKQQEVWDEMMAGFFTMGM